MAYAVYRENSGASRIRADTVFQVLTVSVTSLDACRVRRGIAGCEGAGVLRCEPLLHALLACVPDGEIGPLTSWARICSATE